MSLFISPATWKSVEYIPTAWNASSTSSQIVDAKPGMCRGLSVTPNNSATVPYISRVSYGRASANQYICPATSGTDSARSNPCTVLSMYDMLRRFFSVAEDYGFAGFYHLKKSGLSRRLIRTVEPARAKNHGFENIWSVCGLYNFFRLRLASSICFIRIQRITFFHENIAVNVAASGELLLTNTKRFTPAVLPPQQDSRFHAC